eukprot:g2498.t1
MEDQGHDPNTTPLLLSDDTFVCQDVIIEGTHSITIGQGTVVHPKAVLRALKGPIIIGETNIIEERVEIVNNNENGTPLQIGNFNILEVGSRCQSSVVGNCNVFEVNSVIGPRAVVGDGCVVGVGAQIGLEEEEDNITDGEVIFYLSNLGECMRRKQRMPDCSNEHKAVAKRYVAALSDPKSANFVGNFHHLQTTATSTA